jgi:hypothetical protein
MKKIGPVSLSLDRQEWEFAQRYSMPEYSLRLWLGSTLYLVIHIAPRRRRKSSPVVVTSPNNLPSSSQSSSFASEEWLRHHGGLESVSGSLRGDGGGT